jgi:hypothetical protein
VRKGSAFPKGGHLEPPLPRRLEGSAFQPARQTMTERALAGKPEAFRKAGRRSRCGDQRGRLN